MIYLAFSEFALVASIFYFVPLFLAMLSLGWRTLAVIVLAVSGFLAYCAIIENDPHDGYITDILVTLSACGLAAGAAAKTYQIRTRDDFRDAGTIWYLAVSILLLPDILIQLVLYMKWA